VSPSAGEEGPPGGDYRDGIYEGTGRGYRGKILARVYLNGGEITEIEFFHNDDVSVGGSAMEELAELVLEYNTAGLDGISGATESSAGFLAAVEDALSQARRKP
jgi:fumarate reductase flavoprotein subunit